MNEKQFELYKKILKMPQPVLKHNAKLYLEKMYPKVVETKDYVYAEGEIPICLLAHLDTVFAKQPIGIYYDRVEGVIWSPQGCGHDDRAGVFMIMQILAKGYRPHVIFTTDEEVGCIGASELAKEPMPFKECRYMIQLDRHGYDDCVFYYDENEEFHEYIESFGFLTQIGSFTDIVSLCPEWGVAGVNLSVGYYNEHTSLEVLLTKFYNDTKQKVIKMLENPPAKDFIYIERFGNKYGYFDDDGAFANYSDCQCCNNKTNVDDLFPIVGKDNKVKMFCADCLMKHVDWCDTCNRAFEVDEPLKSGKYMCDECCNKLKKKGVFYGSKGNRSKKCG